MLDSPWQDATKDARQPRSRHQWAQQRRMLMSSAEGQSSWWLMLHTTGWGPDSAAKRAKCSAPNQCYKSSDIWQDSTSIMRFWVSLPWLDSEVWTSSAQNVKISCVVFVLCITNSSPERQRDVGNTCQIVDLWVLIPPTSFQVHQYTNHHQVEYQVHVCNATHVLLDKSTEI